MPGAGNYNDGWFSGGGGHCGHNKGGCIGCMLYLGNIGRKKEI